MRQFWEITKVDEEQRIVSGYASTEAMDSQKEIVTKDAIQAALPEYLKFGNVREMHQNSAVGIAVGAEMDEKGLRLDAHIVDENAWKKVKAKVYKGFSIGGRATARDPDNRAKITGLDLTEISLVDRPANPEALIDIFKLDDGNTTDIVPLEETTEKRDFDAADRKQMAESGEAMPDGSFPIKTKQDVENAIHLAGKAKDPEKAKAHIKARAKALGAEDLIPDTWKADMDTDISKTEAKIDEVEKAGRRNSAKDQDLLQAVHDHSCALGANCPSEDAAKAAISDDIQKMASEVDNLKKALGEKTLAHDELQKAHDTLKTEHEALKKEHETLKAEPKPAKAAITAVSKEADGGTAKVDKEPETAFEAIKKAQQNPMILR
jgi:phage head maturation protease